MIGRRRVATAGRLRLSPAFSVSSYLSTGRLNIGGIAMKPGARASAVARFILVGSAMLLPSTTLQLSARRLWTIAICDRTIRHGSTP